MAAKFQASLTYTEFQASQAARLSQTENIIICMEIFVDKQMLFPLICKQKGLAHSRLCIPQMLHLKPVPRSFDLKVNTLSYIKTPLFLAMGPDDKSLVYFCPPHYPFFWIPIVYKF